MFFYKLLSSKWVSYARIRHHKMPFYQSFPRLRRHTSKPHTPLLSISELSEIALSANWNAARQTTPWCLHAAKQSLPSRCQWYGRSFDSSRAGKPWCCLLAQGRFMPIKFHESARRGRTRLKFSFTLLDAIHHLMM